MSNTDHSKRLAALRLLTDIHDQENGKEVRCWRAFTDDLFFLHWMALGTKQDPLRENERQEVEGHLATCSWCRQEHEERLHLLRNTPLPKMDQDAPDALEVYADITEAVSVSSGDVLVAGEQQSSAFTHSKQPAIVFLTRELRGGKVGADYGVTLSATAIEPTFQIYTIRLRDAVGYGLAPECEIRQEAADGGDVVTIILRSQPSDIPPSPLIVSVLHDGIVLDEQSPQKTGRTYRARLRVPSPAPPWDELSFAFTACEEDDGERFHSTGMA